MKKLLALLLSLVLLTGAFSALAATVTLGVYPPDTETDTKKVHDDYYIPAFKAALPDVELVPSNYVYSVETFTALAESGKVPTIFETWYTEPQKLIRNGQVADITDALQELGWLDKINPSIRALLSDANGRVYGIPRDGYALGMMLNVEVFTDAGLVDENGIPLFPKTWAELIETGKVIKEKTGSAALCLLAQDNAGGWHFSNIAWTFGAQLEKLDDNGKWVSQLNSPAAVEAMTMIQTLSKEGLLTSDPTSENWGTGFAQLGTGAAAMYIAANDAVNQPTQNNGLAVDKLMMIGMPAGSDRSYNLSGGTPYMFSAKATPEEIKAALKYVEIMGRAPVLTEASRTGLKADAEYRVANGIPVIPAFPVWTEEAFNKARADVVTEFSNVDARMFDNYFASVTAQGALKMEEPMETQLMYGELTKVLQEVVTNPDANIQMLLDTANANFQTILDEKINK